MDGFEYNNVSKREYVLVNIYIYHRVSERICLFDFKYLQKNKFFFFLLLMMMMNNFIYKNVLKPKLW